MTAVRDRVHDQLRDLQERVAVLEAAERARARDEASRAIDRKWLPLIAILAVLWVVTTVWPLLP